MQHISADWIFSRTRENFCAAGLSSIKQQFAYRIYLIKRRAFIKFLAFPMRRLFKGGVYFRKSHFLNHWQQLR